jgi:chaperone required for assembly of F1-ATPase
MITSPRPQPTGAVRPTWTPEPLPEGGFRLTWRGRPLRSPARRPLVLPTPALAELLAEPSETTPSPAQRLAFTAVDRVGETREAVADEIARFAGSDLLCYFAKSPEALVERQTAQWDRWLDWADAELGLPLVRTYGVAHTPQPPETLARARMLALELDDFSLSGLAAATSLFGSAVLAFALQRGALSGNAAFDLSRLDEAFQEERWGVDAEAAARAAALASEAQLLDRWLRACKSG